jgi:aspartate kinase
LFETLAKSGASMHLISTSEIKISVLIAEAQLENCVAEVHRAFDLDQAPATITR